jgi:hypothetical protein
MFLKEKDHVVIAGQIHLLFPITTDKEAVTMATVMGQRD